MGMASGNVFCVRGTYTPDSDVASNNIQIQHGLGIQPDFVVAYAEDIAVSSADNVVYIFEGVAAIIDCTSPQTTKPVMGHFVRTRQLYEQVFVQYENVARDKFMTSEWIKIPFYSTGDLLKAGITYHWVAGKYN